MKHLEWKQILIVVPYLIKACLASNAIQESKKQCIGKHQIAIEELYDLDLAKELKEPIAIKNFNVTPVETTLENNDQTIVINMKYNTEVPAINFGASSGLPSYRFGFLYFQWYERSAIILPIELHAVFYNTKIKEFQNALNRKNMIVVLAFRLMLNPTISTKYSVLSKYLKSVGNGLTKIVIENQPLNIWLPVLMKAYIMYEGYFPFHNCTAQVLWVDFETEIFLESELVKNFELLQTSSGRALMKQYQAFLRPSGPFVLNVGVYSTEKGGSMEAIPFVDAYDDDYDGENVPFGRAVQKSTDIRKVTAVIIFLELYLTIL